MKSRHWFLAFLAYCALVVVIVAAVFFESPARDAYLKAMGLFALVALPVVVVVYVNDVRAEREEKVTRNA